MATAKDTADSASRLDPFPRNVMPAGPYRHAPSASARVRLAA
jgi:hypothetical protein